MRESEATGERVQEKVLPQGPRDVCVADPLRAQHPRVSVPGCEGGEHFSWLGENRQLLKVERWQI